MRQNALIAQRIERKLAELEIRVRFPMGTPKCGGEIPRELTQQKFKM